MRFSSFLFALPLALAAPIPSTYQWSMIDFNGNWFSVGYANFKMSAPQTVINGVTVPAIAFTDACHPVNPYTQDGALVYTTDCSPVLSGGAQGRSLVFTLHPFSNDLTTIQYDVAYTFTSAGKKYTIAGLLSHGTSNYPSNFQVTPSTLTAA